jgi:hypothetical protein
VVDVLLREHRDLESARAFFAQAIRRRGRRRHTVVTDKHAAYGRAVWRHARRATPIKTGRHRARGATTTPVERSHAPVKDRLRAMRDARAALHCDGATRPRSHRGGAGAAAGGPLHDAPTGAGWAHPAMRARRAALGFPLLASDLRCTV